MKTAILQTTALCALALAASLTPGRADTFDSGAFSIPFQTIADPGNAADTTGYGAVSYTYRMGIIDVSQAMINSALTDGPFASGSLGTGTWTGNQPSANITWYQAAAFVNWLNTSQGYTAAYNLSYLGGGNYTLTPWSAGQAALGGTDLYRNGGAYYFLPTENEFYKAAFYDPNRGGPGIGGYWNYADGSNSAPTATTGGTTPGTAVYTAGATIPSGPAAVDQAGGLSPYGTQGQDGNVYQWMESSATGTFGGADTRVVRGGAYNSSSAALLSTFRSPLSPNTAAGVYGFRVASVPEPSSALLIVGAGIFSLLQWRRRPSF